MAYDYAELFAELSDEDAGKLIKAIFVYETKKELPNFPKKSLLYFAFYTNIKLQIDHNSEAYNAVCEKRSAAGKQGGRPKKSKESKCLIDKAEKANASFEKQKKQMLLLKSKKSKWGLIVIVIVTVIVI